MKWKYVNRWLCWAASFCFWLALVFGCVQSVCFDRDFYQKEYQKWGQSKILGTTQEELMRVTDDLLSYVQGGSYSMDIKMTMNGQVREAFDEREKQHMVDVAALYQNWAFFQKISLLGIVMIWGIAWFGFKQRRLGFYGESYLMGGAFLLALLLGSSLWAAWDFSSFWTALHYVLFDNDLWILNTDTSIMLQFFPEPFFDDLVRAIVWRIGWFVGLPWLVGGGVWLWKRPSKR